LSEIDIILTWHHFWFFSISRWNRFWRILSLWCCPWKFKTFLFSMSTMFTSQNYSDI